MKKQTIQGESLTRKEMTTIKGGRSTNAALCAAISCSGTLHRCAAIPDCICNIRARRCEQVEPSGL